MKRIAIIGGGAAGLAAAVSAGFILREHSVSDVQIVLFEARDRVGRSILASGNGRCNFSNSHIDVSRYHNGIFVAKVLTAFEELMSGGFPSGSASALVELQRTDVSRETFSASIDAMPVSIGVTYDGAGNVGSGCAGSALAEPAPNGVARFFESLGLLWREESEGRLYPKANKSSAVLDVLRAAMAACSVEVRTEAHVSCVVPPCADDDRFTIHTEDGLLERADSVVVACGGAIACDMLADDAGNFGFMTERPVLGPIATDTKWVKQLDNIRVKCAIELHRGTDVVSREVGEVLFRKYGVSGIAAFNLSRLAEAGDTLSIDLFPAIALDSLEAHFSKRADMLEATFGNGLACIDFLRGTVLPQVAHVLCEYAGIAPGSRVSEGRVLALARACKDFCLEYRGIGDEAQCQVRRGGFIPECFFSEKTLQAALAPGLFMAGEAFDVDGPCGGYNLHWAFASGVLAGANAVLACL